MTTAGCSPSAAGSRPRRVPEASSEPAGARRDVLGHVVADGSVPLAGVARALVEADQDEARRQLAADLGVEQHNFRYVAEQAGKQGIIINAIYGGNREQGITELWDQVAKHGGGSYSAIDMKFGTAQIATPFDSTLQLLNDELNGTYIPYGEKGPEALANLLAQDVNARRLGAQSCGSRIAAKACAIYKTASWDLVDAVSEEGFVLADVKQEDLPVQKIGRASCRERV